MSELQHGQSLHRLAGGETKTITRKWDPIHVEAGYDEQEWGSHSTPDHELLGEYDYVDANGSQVVTVRHLASGPTGGPEFEIEWEDGMKVTVLDDKTVIEYLAAGGAVEIEPDE